MNFGELLVVGDGDEVAVRIAADERVGGILAGQRRRFEFVFGHVDRIEIRARRFGSDARDERSVVGQSVPGSVVDLGEPAGGGVVDRLQ